MEETGNRLQQQSMFDEGSVSYRGSSYTEFMMTVFRRASRERSKAIGQFFTPSEIFNPLVKKTSRYISDTGLKAIRVIDPFCGDGRLLVSLLETLSDEKVDLDEVTIVGWDIDSTAVSSSMAAIKETAAQLPYRVNIQIERKDAFLCESSYYGSFDVCITNPPWSSTKSLKARAFVDEEEYKHYQILAGEYTKILCGRFPKVKAGASFGTGAINLSRFGMKLSVELIRKSGLCAIVMPSSFAGDTSSRRLREDLFRERELASLDYYPAELKLFEGADQAGIAIVLTNQSGDASSGSVVSHMKNEKLAYDIDENFRRYSSRNGYSIPLGYSDSEMRLIERLSDYPLLGSMSQYHLGREVDETRIADRLCKKSAYRFVKGFMIMPYQLIEDQQWFYNDKVASIPPSAHAEKVVWRDISRASQEKRIKATLLPEGFVAGNSLGVATASDGAQLRVLVAVLNSRVFEFMARTMLTTNHVSAGVLKRLPMPCLRPDTECELAVLVNQMLDNPTSLDIYDQIEALVSQGYGLDKHDMQLVSNKISFSNLDRY